jgi:redox-sensitive bicupin YhaK (pirin superfamily)
VVCTTLFKGRILVLILDDQTRVRIARDCWQTLGVPIVQHGPFVMNTKEKIFQVIIEFREGHLANAKRSSTTFF